MPTRVYRLYHSSLGSASALAQLDIRKAGKLTGFVVAQSYKAGGADDIVEGELSFVPAGQIGTNDTIGQVGTWAIGGNIAAARSTLNHQVDGLSIPVAVGTRLYLHGFTSGTPTAGHCHVCVHVDE